MSIVDSQPELSEKVHAAEEHVALVRVAVVAVGTTWFLAGGAAEAQGRSALILALAWVYGMGVLFLRPYRRWPMLLSSWATTITDAIFSTLWIWATGGFGSSWFLLYYLGVAATAFRFRAAETWIAATAYSASYLVLLVVMGTAGTHAIEIGLRIAFIFLVAGLCGPLASETVEQVRQKVAMRNTAHQAEAAAARLRGILEGARTPLLMFDGSARIEFINAEAQALFGISPGEAIGKPPDALLLKITEPEAARKAIARAMESGAAVEQALTLRRSRNDVREVIAIFSAWHDRERRPLGMVAVCYDETARRQRDRDVRSLRIRLEEAERRRIARELHDQVGQILTGLALSLDSTARRGPVGPEQLENARGLVNDLMGRVRALSLDLRPAVLDDLGLMPALQSLFERVERQTGVKVAFKQTGLEKRFDPEIETAAFRVVQEALTNVAKHSGAKAATVRAWADEESLSVQVEDAGKGFDPEAVIAATSSGLAGMRERASLLGGELTVESTDGGGARLTAELPLGVRTESSGTA